jgi:peptidyl-prolyl cis-trans isomerase D
MLQQIREFAGRKIVRWLFIIFLVVPFGLFGIDAYINRVATTDAVANVGPLRVTAFELDQALRRQAELYREQFRGQFDASIMENPEIRRAVLDNLVNEKLMAVGSERAGVRIPDAALAERISRMPEFQGADGRFSKERYDMIAKSQGLTTPGLDERLRQSFRMQDFRAAIADTAFVPKATLESFIRLSEQSREVSVVNLTPEAYPAKVSPEQAKAYYDSHAVEFTIPERVRVEYVELSVDALAARTAAPAEDVQRVYEDGMKRNQWGAPEERRASHILVGAAADAKEPERKAAKDKAQAIADRVRKDPKSFADVAKKESQDPGSAVQGGDLGFFAREAMVKPFSEAAFAAKKGDIVGPVESEFGYHVILVTDVKPAKVRTLAESTPEIEAQIKKQLASRAFAETGETFTNMVYEQSSSLQPVADALKLTVKTAPQWLTKGQPSAPPLGNPKLMAEIFSDDAIKAKRNTSAVEVSPGTLISARVVEHKPSELRPIESARAEIDRKLAREESLKLARADGEAKLKELQAGKDPGVKWPAPLAVNRQKPGGLFPQVIDRAFRADGKKLPAFLGVESPAGYSLVRVTKVIEVEKVDDKQRDAMGGQLRQALAAEEMEATLASLRGRVGVTVRKDALEKKTPQQ